jgi:hypothetical protein
MPSTLDGIQIIKPMYENAAMVDDETRTIKKEKKDEKKELEELRKRISALPEITIAPPE